MIPTFRLFVSLYPFPSRENVDSREIYFTLLAITWYALCYLKSMSKIDRNGCQADSKRKGNIAIKIMMSWPALLETWLG